MPPAFPADDASPRFPLLARAVAPLVGLVVAAAVLTLARSPFRAVDTYFHLRLGEEFLTGRWSISAPGQPSVASTAAWVPTQWLPEAALAWIDDHLGDPGLSALLALLVGAYALVCHLTLRRITTPAGAAVATAVVVLGSLPFLSLRPQVLSYLFAALLLALWRGVALGATSTARLWWLVPLTWVWAMCHGMWIVGVGASVVLAVGVAAQRRGAGLTRRDTRALVAVPVATGAVALLTPAGPALLAQVVTVNGRASHFDEWRAPELLSATGAPVALVLALAVLALVVERAVPPYEVALLALGGGLAVYSTRTLPLALFTLVTVVLAARERRRQHPGPPRVGPRETFVGLALVAAVVVAAPLLPQRGAPADALRPFDARLSALPAGSRVLTDREAGTILLHTHPGLDVAIHAYGDMYTDRELDRYDALARLAPGWRTTLRGLDPRVAVLPRTAPLTEALTVTGWRTSERAGTWLLLVPPQGTAS
ncbi:hypothetical protein [Nocardioides sp.]|uniref:hypothetical protein n=1 Tax=Nocardioides sp. TaxID=35761 RepID=UPI0035199EB7